MNRLSLVLFGFLLAPFAALANLESDENSKAIYEIHDQSVLEILDTTANYDVIASGFAWAEGPLWVAKGNYLLFSDIPNNKVYKFSPEHGLSEYLSNSGYSNGLLLDNQGRLTLLQSRSRVVAQMNSDIDTPKDEFNVVAKSFQGKRFNSPNDGALHKNGSIYFTDPPYGLPKQLDDPSKELSFQGVYRLLPNGEITLLDSSLTFPNGIALSTKQNALFVAVSDKNQPIWYRYELDQQGDVTAKRVLYRPSQNDGEIGSPDGLKVHSTGIVFATGPGGIWVLSEQGKLLARIKLPGFNANLAFNENESMLYITADNELRQLKLNQPK
ncbi:SMP-30/gluconolactonase/LRE family protein [Thalassotalea agarivorans]|uniref:Gluconolactonase n=1 Tax=Thalassotalea agarivorans TaxID=349064 RepID=A0A1I0ATL3_THASX|nr:SMP-30/gluconolactonase/LRE family protein [Thalassotalea agarivorans]SES97536.1 gluconolactonase [Thalassotalea agarivorans]